MTDRGPARTKSRLLTNHRGFVASDAKFWIRLAIVAGVFFLFGSRAAAQEPLPLPPVGFLIDADDQAPVVNSDTATPVDPPAFPPPAPTPQAKPAGRGCSLGSFGQCISDFLHDQVGIWTSPAHIRGHDFIWLLPFAGATSAAIVYDSQALKSLEGHSDFARRSKTFSESGSPYVTLGAPAVAYFIGALSHNETFEETGKLGVEAVADVAVVVEALKLVSNRERPDTGSGNGDFWPHGTQGFPRGDFPSMHAAGSFALARVIDGQYPHRFWLKALVYGWATAVSVTRVTGRQHFPSDVLVGGTFGFLTGNYVVRHHSSVSGVDYSFTLVPYSDQRTASYGLTLMVPPEALAPHVFGKLLRNSLTHSN